MKLRAFSFIEIIFVIIILGILGSMAISRFSDMRKRTCIKYLKTELEHTQERIDTTLQHSFLHKSDFSSMTILKDLENLTISNPKNTPDFPCYFEHSDKYLNAKIGTETLRFNIQSFENILDSTYNRPRIYCSIDIPTCREFYNKLLSK